MTIGGLAWGNNQTSADGPKRDAERPEMDFRKAAAEGKIEMLTQHLKAGTKIDEQGGVIPAIEMGYFQREIAEASSEYQNKVELKQRVIVGVNEFMKENEEIEIPILEIRKEVEEEQISM